MALVNDAPFNPSPDPETDLAAWQSGNLVDQERAAANRLGTGARLSSRGDLAKEGFIIREPAPAPGRTAPQCRLLRRLYHWPVALIEIACVLQISFVKPLSACRRNTTSQPQHQPQ